MRLSAGTQLMVNKIHPLSLVTIHTERPTTQMQNTNNHDVFHADLPLWQMPWALQIGCSRGLTFLLHEMGEDSPKPRREHMEWCGAFYASDKRRFHMLRYRGVILVYARLKLNFMLIEIAYVWPIVTTLDIYFHYLRKGHIEQKKKKKCEKLNVPLPGMPMLVLLWW